MNKYRNKRTDGYASQAEAKRGGELRLLAQVKAITHLREQVRFELLPANKEIGYSRPLVYVCDFAYREDGRDICEDVKGMRTPVYKIKKRLMRQLLGIEIREV